MRVWLRFIDLQVDFVIMDSGRKRSQTVTVAMGKGTFYGRQEKEIRTDAGGAVLVCHLGYGSGGSDLLEH